jgi:uncharacterized membrane protein YphA (DoxX/SURF4 family)
MHPFCILLARLALGGMWVIAGIAKLSERGGGGKSVAAFGLVPGAAAEPVGRGLPWMEATLGLLLLVGIETRAAAAGSSILLLAFGLGIAVNLMRGRKIECHCFGQMSHGVISWWSVLRNGALIAVAMVVVSGPPHYLAVDGWLRGGAVRPGDPSPLELVPVILIALAGVLVAALLAPAWQIARAIATARGGPALRTAERRFLRRVLGQDGRRPTRTAAPGIGNRR